MKEPAETQSLFSYSSREIATQFDERAPVVLF
jgi:hypothetical protein